MKNSNTEARCAEEACFGGNPRRAKPERTSEAKCPQGGARHRDGWRKVRLGEIADFIQTGPFGSQLHQSDYNETGTPVVMPKDLIDGGVSESSVARVGDEHVERLSRHQVRQGDFLFSRRGDVGRCALVREKESGWLCGTGCLRVGINHKLADSRFLLYCFSQQDVVSWLEGHAVGATMPNINPSILSELPFSLPPLPTQQRIAEILGAYDDAIENNRRRIALLEKMARELYRERFVRRAGKGIARRTLGEIGIRLESGSRPKGGIQDIDDGIPSVGAENVIGLGQYNYDSEKLVSRDFFAKMKRGVIRDRDILLYKDGAYIGRVSLFQDGFPHEEAAINEHVFLVHANDELLQYYIFFTLAQERYFKIMQGLNENAAQPGLNQGSVLGLKIEWPKREKIEAFNKLVEPMVAEIFSLALQNRNLARQRDRLLPRLMSGRLGVGS